jgi:hypothetical protein
VSAPEALEGLVLELERTAAELRAGRLEGPQAADAVERCAGTATRLGAELDRLARARPEGPDPGQEDLL